MTIPLNPFASRYYSAELITETDGFVKLNFIISTDDIHIGLLGYQKDGSIEIQSALGNNNRLLGSIETRWAWQNLDKVGLVFMNSNPEERETFAFQVTEHFIDQQIQLAQNFPNPFNPQTTIRISIPQNQEVKLDVFDILGRHIQTIYEGPVNAGFRDFQFDATALSSGVYFYRIEGEFGGVQTKAMTLIK